MPRLRSALAWIQGSCPPPHQRRGRVSFWCLRQADRRAIEERQLQHATPGLHEVATPRCHHGYPQAFAYHPVQNTPGVRISGRGGSTILSDENTVRAIRQEEHISTKRVVPLPNAVFTAPRVRYDCTYKYIVLAPRVARAAGGSVSADSQLRDKPSAGSFRLSCPLLVKACRSWRPSHTSRARLFHLLAREPCAGFPRDCAPVQAAANE